MAWVTALSITDVALTFAKLEFVRTLSSDAQNVVIGLVRNQAAAEKAFGADVPKNLSFLQADITNLDALKVETGIPNVAVAQFGCGLIIFKSAATKTAELTGGGLDYLINNAALVSSTSRYRTLGDL